MSNELIPSVGDSLPVSSGQGRERGPYPAPSWWSEAGMVDRRNEARHVLAIREEVRRSELDQVQEARKLAASITRLEATARYTLQAKLVLEEAERRSRLLAGDNPVLQQQFAVLDDTLFQAARSEQISRGVR